MAINVSAQYNGGLLPDIVLTVDPMLLYHRETRLNAMQRVLFLQPMILSTT